MHLYKLLDSEYIMVVMCHTEGTIKLCHKIWLAKKQADSVNNIYNLQNGTYLEQKIDMWQS